MWHMAMIFHFFAKLKNDVTMFHLRKKVHKSAYTMQDCMEFKKWKSLTVELLSSRIIFNFRHLSWFGSLRQFS